MDRSDSTLKVCCHLGIATEHAIYACSFATALCRFCCRASYKRREACEQIFPSSLYGKADMRLRLRLLCVSERHCYRACLQSCSNLSIRHAPRGRCMKKSSLSTSHKFAVCLPAPRHARTCSFLLHLILLASAHIFDSVTFFSRSHSLVVDFESCCGGSAPFVKSCHCCHSIQPW